MPMQLVILQATKLQEQKNPRRQMHSHGVGKYGVRVTWKGFGQRQNEIWSLTKEERERDYDMHKNKKEVYSVTRIER